MHGSKWGKLYSIQSWKAVGPAIGTIVIYLPACHKGESPAVADPEGKQENRKSLFISSNSGSSQVVKWRIFPPAWVLGLLPTYQFDCAAVTVTRPVPAGAALRRAAAVWRDKGRPDLTAAAGQPACCSTTCLPTPTTWARKTYNSRESVPLDRMLRGNLAQKTQATNENLSSL